MQTVLILELRNTRMMKSNEIESGCVRENVRIESIFLSDGH